MLDVVCFSLVFNDELIRERYGDRIDPRAKALWGPSAHHKIGIVFPFHQPHPFSTRQSTMYEETWYTYVSDSHKRDDASTQDAKHRRKESLLKQTNVSPLLARSWNCTNGRSREQAKYLTLRVQSWNYLREVPD